jgi:hypothetical protein
LDDLDDLDADLTSGEDEREEDADRTDELDDLDGEDPDFTEGAGLDFLTGAVCRTEEVDLVAGLAVLTAGRCGAASFLTLVVLRVAELRVETDGELRRSLLRCTAVDDLFSLPKVLLLTAAGALPVLGAALLLTAVDDLSVVLRLLTAGDALRALVAVLSPTAVDDLPEAERLLTFVDDLLALLAADLSETLAADVEAALTELFAELLPLLISFRPVLVLAYRASPLSRRSGRE